MPRITRRSRTPPATIEPKTFGPFETPDKSMDEILAAILPRPGGALNFQEAIKIAEQLLPPAAIAAVGHAGLALAKADRDGTPAPPEAASLLQMMASVAIAPDMFKLLRTQFGISQQEIAKAYGVRIQAVLSWEKGKTSLPREAILVLLKLAAERTAIQVITGNDIVLLRRTLGLSQPRFAETIGVTPLTIFNWEKRGDRPLPLRASAKVRECYAEELARAA